MEDFSFGIAEFSAQQQVLRSAPAWDRRGSPRRRKFSIVPESSWSEALFTEELFEEFEKELPESSRASEIVA
jgi:hypothetical protein